VLKSLYKLLPESFLFELFSSLRDNDKTTEFISKSKISNKAFQITSKVVDYIILGKDNSNSNINSNDPQNNKNKDLNNLKNQQNINGSDINNTS